MHKPAFVSLALTLAASAFTVACGGDDGAPAGPDAGPIGCTTPKKKEGGKWKDLDARTVYDWK